MIVLTIVPLVIRQKVNKRITAGADVMQKVKENQGLIANRPLQSLGQAGNGKRVASKTG
jgi:hypothetical protein